MEDTFPMDERERKENVIAACGLRCPQDSGRTKEDQAILWVVTTFNGDQELRQLSLRRDSVPATRASWRSEGKD